jgi:hypothetical protein
MTNRLWHRLQARRVARALREIYSEQRVPTHQEESEYDAISARLLAIFKLAISCCEKDGRNSLLLRNWSRLAQAATECLEDHLRHAEVNPDPLSWTELMVLAFWPEHIDRQIESSQGWQKELGDRELQAIGEQLRVYETKIATLVKKIKVPDYELPQLTVTQPGESMIDRLLLAQVMLQEPDIDGRTRADESECVGHSVSPTGATRRAARCYIVRFADNEWNLPAQNRRLRVYYQENPDEGIFYATGPVDEGSIEGREFQDEAGERYHLVEPHALYGAWLLSNGVEPNESDPLAFSRTDANRWVMGPFAPDPEAAEQE